MTKRPLAVTIISWFLIVGGVISVFSISFSLNNPIARDMMSKSLLPIPVQVAMVYVGVVIGITSGVAMLKCRKWGRTLYVSWSALGFFVSLVTSPLRLMLIPSILVFGIIVYFLFRPDANEYFNAGVK
ncbi:MAG: hypothetical protein HZC51_12565 [Nitrospirae bacterium]|nr:hypothetical protein [Nitrospirota bacterium]